MSRRQATIALIVVALLAFISGSAATAAVLMGPLGVRSPSLLARATPSAATTPSSVSTPPPDSFPSPLPPGTLPPPGAPPSAAADSCTGPVPCARFGAALAFDAARGKLLLFGGAIGTGYGFVKVLNDTWSWNGTAWKLEQPGPGPVVRYYAATAYDPRRGAIVLHGGHDANNVQISDTWTWNGARWLLMSPSQSPPKGGYDQPMVWDSAHGQVLLFDWTGGWIPPELNELWAWDGANWTLLPISSAPSGHGIYPGAIAYDSARKSLVLFGHVNSAPTTWTFDGNTWSKVSTTSGSGSTYFVMAPDEARSRVVLFGENGDTWTWDGSAWTAQNPPHAPSARRGAGMTYDPVRHVVVLFGGNDSSTGTTHELNDLWTWNGTDWTKIG